MDPRHQPADRERQPLLAPPEIDLARRAEVVELLEDAGERGLHRLVGGEPERVELVARGRDRERLPAPRLAPARLDHAVHGVVALQLAHLPADAQHQPVRARGGVENSLFVRDQGLAPAAEVHEVVPVRIVARGARARG
jgi:hypothetical protein